ncbi:MAG: rRNA maturation RNase YbeY [Eubacteriaceae bacterium]|nr:rRNA maturation RNase YbeY [Eubacteriaceae bacterium]
MELMIGETARPSEKVMGHMKQAADMALAREGVPAENIEVSVTFVDMEEIRELNKMYRDTDKTTDVLSFPQFGSRNEIPSDKKTTIGDVVICTEQALLQADDYGHSVERELVYLFVHSMFHLLGYDHMDEKEKAEMRKAEEEIMAEIGLER